MTQIRESKCDFCNNIYYHKSGVNKRRGGYPVYMLCQFCYDWSLPKRMKRAEACSAKVLQGSLYKPATSGKKFSQSYNKTYKTTHRKVIGAETSERQQSASKEHMENEVAAKRYPSRTSPFKDAVQVVESGVSGFLHGASDALSSLLK